MLKNCTLIATLPNLNRIDKVKEILKNQNICGARFNTGVNCLMNIPEVIYTLKELSNMYGKPIWIDIKGRQLRITKWADPSYEAIELNHNVEIVYPAKIYFRNGTSTDIVRTKGNKIIVDPIPKSAVGAGQSVNIIAKDLEILGYLTESDKEYLQSCNEIGMNNIMASFVESESDIKEIIKYLPNANITSKIESLKGIKYILENNEEKSLMAARDDLYIESGMNANILRYLKYIIEKDPNAICASRIFTSLERQNYIDFSDYTDLELMYSLGYRKFMLCDNICNYHFEDAIKGWEMIKK